MVERWWAVGGPGGGRRGHDVWKGLFVPRHAMGRTDGYALLLSPRPGAYAPGLDRIQDQRSPSSTRAVFVHKIWGYGNLFDLLEPDSHLALLKFESINATRALCYLQKSGSGAEDDHAAQNAAVCFQGLI